MRAGRTSTTALSGQGTVDVRERLTLGVEILDLHRYADALAVDHEHDERLARVAEDPRSARARASTEILTEPQRSASDNDRMASLLVITGPPGAGKSTVARALADSFERSVLVAGDAFFGSLAKGAIAPWLPEANEQNEVVTRAAASATGRYVDGGYDTVYDGVVGAWFLPTFIEATGLDELHYVVLLPSVECCIQRVRTRERHGFTDEPATVKMHHEFTNAELAPRHVMVDPPEGVDAVVDQILGAVDAGTLRYRR